MLLKAVEVAVARVGDAHDSFHCIPDAFNRRGGLQPGEPLAVLWQLVRQSHPNPIHPIVLGHAPLKIDAGGLRERALPKVKNCNLRPIPSAAAGVPNRHANVVEHMGNPIVHNPMLVRVRYGQRNGCARPCPRDSAEDQMALAIPQRTPGPSEKLVLAIPQRACPLLSPRSQKRRRSAGPWAAVVQAALSTPAVAQAAFAASAVAQAAVAAFSVVAAFSASGQCPAVGP